MINKINVNLLYTFVLFYIFVNYDLSFLTDDYKTYNLYYLSDSNELEDGSRVEYLYFILNKLFYRIGISFNFFYLSTIFICTYLFIDKYRYLTRLIGGSNFQIFIPFIFLFTLFENFSTVIFRSYIAAVLIVIGLVQLFLGNYKKYFICAAIGIGIQSLSFFGFVIILFSYFQAINKSSRFLRLYSISILILFSFACIFKDYIGYIFLLIINNYFVYYSIYNTGVNNFFAEISYLKITTIVLILFCILIIIKNKNFFTNTQKFIAFFMVNCLLLTTIVPFPLIRARLFIFIQMIILIFLIRYLNLLGINIILSIFLVILPFVF